MPVAPLSDTAGTRWSVAVSPDGDDVGDRATDANRDCHETSAWSLEAELGVIENQGGNPRI